MRPAFLYRGGVFGSETGDEIRISRFLSGAGVASRRHADLLIEQGRVLVNGRKASLGEAARQRIGSLWTDAR